MGNKAEYKKELASLFRVFLETRDNSTLIEYLVSKSNLPGVRANLELAEVFAENVEEVSSRDPELLLWLCDQFTIIAPDEAPTNNPREFLPFCGTWALGALASISPKFNESCWHRLKKMSIDSRWRIREAVAFGLQMLLKKERERNLERLDRWIEDEKWLQMRAVAAGIAEPSLLKHRQTAKRALEFHKKILARIISARERNSFEFKTLRKGLGYTLSVVTYAIPKEGFEFMRQLVDSQDADVQWIIKENLKKNRLIKNLPDEVASIKRLLQAKTRT